MDIQHFLHRCQYPLSRTLVRGGLFQYLDGSKIHVSGYLHAQHLRTDIDQYASSITEIMVDKQVLMQKMVDKWSIKPTLVPKLADILEFVADKEVFTIEDVVRHFSFTTTTAKRYLRQLTEFGYLEACGGNRNRSYKLRHISDK